MSDPWKIEEDSFSRVGSVEDRLRFLIRYAILAPSGHNTQPWHFTVDETAISVFADRTRALPVVDPDDRALTISCGAAVFHLRVAMIHFGFEPVMEILPEVADADLLARVSFGGHVKETAEQRSMFQSIPHRRTNRNALESRDLAQELLDRLTAISAEEGAWFHVVEGDTRNRLADLIAEGDRIQASDKRFRRELAAWVHHNRSRSCDGIPLRAFGMGDVMSYVGPFLIRTFDWGNGKAAKDRELAQGSPVLAVLGTEGDSARDWISAGQALAAALLRARAEGIFASFLNQPIEVEALRPRVRDLIGRTGFPQLVLRMGYGNHVEPTPRRPVQDVLL